LKSGPQFRRNLGGDRAAQLVTAGRPDDLHPGCATAVGGHRGHRGRGTCPSISTPAPCATAETAATGTTSASTSSITALTRAMISRE
jgi:hypothetical protein